MDSLCFSEASRAFFCSSVSLDSQLTKPINAPTATAIPAVERLANAVPSVNVAPSATVAVLINDKNDWIKPATQLLTPLITASANIAPLKANAPATAPMMIGVNASKIGFKVPNTLFTDCTIGTSPLIPSVTNLKKPLTPAFRPSKFLAILLPVTALLRSSKAFMTLAIPLANALTMLFQEV